MSKAALKTIAMEENEEMFGFVFAVSGPGKYLQISLQKKQKRWSCLSKI